MNKIEQAGSVAKLNPGMTSISGNNVSNPDQKIVSPVAGYRISSENMHRMHQKLMSVVPYEAFIAPFLEDGGIITDEVA